MNHFYVGTKFEKKTAIKNWKKKSKFTPCFADSYYFVQRRSQLTHHRMM